MIGLSFFSEPFACCYTSRTYCLSLVTYSTVLLQSENIRVNWRGCPFGTVQWTHALLKSLRQSFGNKKTKSHYGSCKYCLYSIEMTDALRLGPYAHWFRFMGNRRQIKTDKKEKSHCILAGIQLSWTVPFPSTESLWGFAFSPETWVLSTSQNGAKFFSFQLHWDPMCLKWAFETE